MEILITNWWQLLLFLLAYELGRQVGNILFNKNKEDWDITIIDDKAIPWGSIDCDKC